MRPIFAGRQFQHELRRRCFSSGLGFAHYIFFPFVVETEKGQEERAGQDQCTDGFTGSGVWWTPVRFCLHGRPVKN